MRFYFTGPGEGRDEGILLPDAETALTQAADALLAMARDRIVGDALAVSLEVHSDEGPVGVVTVKVSVDRP